MDRIKHVKLSDISQLITKGTTPTTLGFEFQNSGVSFLKIECFDENGNYIPEKTAHISEECNEKLKRSQLKAGDILFSIAGAIGRVAVVKEEMLPANTNQAMAIIRIDRDDVYLPYVTLILSSPLIKAQFEKKKQGVAQLNISLKDVNELEIPLPECLQQVSFVDTFDKVRRIIQDRKKELQTLDDLIKARFVEMFGDPVRNSAHLPILPMTEVCEIIDGDRGKNYPKQEDFFENEYCLFLNAKNVTNHGFDFSECMFITKAKDMALRKGKLQRGDVVLTTRGTLGNLAFYTDDVPYNNIRINSGMVILRMNRKIIDEGFFIEQFRMQVDDIKKTIASGSAQPQLPISTMNKISIIMPDLTQQKRFSSFVAQVDKLKSVVQKALNEAHLLLDSLMQKYFG